MVSWSIQVTRFIDQEATVLYIERFCLFAWFQFTQKFSFCHKLSDNILVLFGARANSLFSSYFFKVSSHAKDFQ